MSEDTIRQLQNVTRKYLKEAGLVPDEAAVDTYYKEQGGEPGSPEDGGEAKPFKALIHVPPLDIPETIDKLRVTQVLCSAEQSDKGNYARNVIDGDPKTRWSAKGDQWIQLDLGVPQEIHRLNIGYYDGANRKYLYELFGLAPDNKNLIRIGGGQSSGRLSEGSLESVSFAVPLTTKAIRYLGHGNNLNTWNSILEMQLEGRLVNKPAEKCKDNEFFNPDTLKCEPIPDCGPDAHFDLALLKCMPNAVTPPSGTGMLYTTEQWIADMTPLIGQKLKKETGYGQLKVIWPSGASGDEWGPDNHLVLKKGDLIYKRLMGNQVRDYYNFFRVKATPNIEFGFKAIPNAKCSTVSMKCGQHSLDGFEFGGYGGSVAEDEIESQVEFNHDESVGGSNGGPKKWVKPPKEIVYDGKKEYGFKFRLQSDYQKLEKVLNLFVQYPGEDTFTPVMTNRVWTNSDWKQNDKWAKGGPYKDTAEMKKGIYLGLLYRAWIRCNEKEPVKEKKAIIDYTAPYFREIEPLSPPTAAVTGAEAVATEGQK